MIVEPWVPWILRQNEAAIVVGAICVLFLILLPLGLLWRWVRKRELARKHSALLEAQIRYYSAAPPSAPPVYMAPPSQPQVVYREKEVVREVVKVACKYCGTFNYQTSPSCVSCGARI